MADSTSLSILRQTPLSSEIATKEWTSENFLSITADIQAANTIELRGFKQALDSIWRVEFGTALLIFAAVVMVQLPAAEK